MRVSVHACERVCRDTQMHYWTVLPHASRNLEERAVGLGAPPPTQGSLGGTSHNATPSKGRHPRSEVGSDSRGRRSLTCVAAPVSAPVSLKSCHLMAPGPRHLIWFMPGPGPWRCLSTLGVCACIHMYIAYTRAFGGPWR